MSSPALATTLVAALCAAGVTEVVLSPGSRNGGIALALAAAEKRGELRLQVVLDERGAGFLGLGLAKATGRPVAVVVTSGTAVANLAPAVAEAHHAGVALVVVSADRPVSMHDSGASQTTRQVGLFGALLRQVTRLSSQSGEVADWAWQIRRTVGLAVGVRTRHPGPVQVNVELAEPLLDESVLHPARPGRWAKPGQDDQPLVPAEVQLSAGPRTVVLAGDCHPELGEAAVRLAEQGRVPLLAEPSSNARRGAQAIAGYRRLVTGPLATQIERVIVVGHPTLSRPVMALLRRDDVEVIVLSDRSDPPVPGMRGNRVVSAMTLASSDDEVWCQQWRTADGGPTAGPVDATASPGGALSAADVAAAVWSSTGGADLMVGSSASIRLLDEVPITADPPRVWANRGLAGIDGTLHTAAGLALGLDRAVTVLLGDLTFLHDLTGLVIGEHESRQPLRIVVIDDHGGAIFHGLEQGAAAYAEHFERVFGTPQRTDLVAAAAGLGVAARPIVTQSELDEALAAALTETEVLVVRVSRGPVQT